MVVMSSAHPPTLTAQIPSAIEELSSSIVTLATDIHAATQRLLEMLRAFDEARGWQLEGQAS